MILEVCKSYCMRLTYFLYMQKTTYLRECNLQLT